MKRAPESRPGELPTGTVTFLFTDIEGSTRLLHELGERYADVLAEHRRVLRETFARHGGVEVDTQGDAFFYAFQRASDAVAAAQEAQETLSEGPVRVRIGIHTGEPIQTGEGYTGVDVHRAARIAAAGHGGQVLVSETTRRLLDSKVELRDVGEHRLKDLSAPQRLWQLGDAEFPPLRTLSWTNLPVAGSPLVGRGNELRELLDLLTSGHRVVTVTGAGGSGKTRLALQAAGEAVDRYRDGVFWVSLAGLTDSRLVLPAVAQTLGAKEDLAKFLAGRQTLLVLDNFEHVLSAAEELSRLLRGAPNVQVLVTSRSRLRIDGEYEQMLDSLCDGEAVTLFVERARAAGRSLAPDGTVREICRRVDNLPLPIELAAARAKVLAPPALLARLEQRLPLLTGGRRDVPERQRTLRATIDWSYELLGEEARRLFARLSVFGGSFSVEAAELVCGAELDELAALVELSLLKAVGDDRFTMLETVREHALGLLVDGGDAESVKRGHAEYFLALVEGAEERLEGRDQSVWFARLDEDHANVRVALERANQHGWNEIALGLAGGLSLFWWVRGYWSEGRQWLEEALSAAAEQLHAPRAKALEAAAQLAARQGDFGEARRRVEESLTLRRQLGDARGVGRSLRVLAYTAGVEGDTEQASALLEQSAHHAREAGDLWTLSMALNNLGYEALVAGNYERARELFEESLALGRQRGDTRSLALFLEGLALAALRDSRLDEALAHFAESLRFAVEVGYLELVGCDVDGIAGIVALAGHEETAARLLAGADVLLARTGGRRDWIEQQVYDDAVEVVRRHLDDETLAAAWAAGSTMSPDEIIEEALAAANDRGARPDDNA